MNRNQRRNTRRRNSKIAKARTRTEGRAAHKMPRKRHHENRFGSKKRSILILKRRIVNLAFNLWGRFGSQNLRQMIPRELRELDSVPVLEAAYEELVALAAKQNG